MTGPCPPAQERFRVLLLVRVEEGAEPDFLRAYDATRLRVATAEGYLGEQLGSSATDPREWLITSEWRSAGHYRAWAESDGFAQLAGPVVSTSSRRTHLPFHLRRETRPADSAHRAGPPAQPEGAPMTSQRLRVVDASEIEPHSHIGGTMWPLLTPTTAGATKGYLGTGVIQVDDRIGEHYHPYSEEFLYIVSGEVVADVNDEKYPLHADQGMVIPIGYRHRVRNTGTVEARIVYHLCPLAPSPQEGHVNTELPEQP